MRFPISLLLRRQGLATLQRIRSESAAGRVPAKPLFEGAVLAVAAILMIIPGFLTDVAGLLLFIPPVRIAMWQRIRRGIEVRVERHAADRAASPAVVELDHSQYAAAPRPDSPWRDGGRAT